MTPAIQYHASITIAGSQAGGLGHLLQYMREYNAESSIQGRKRFNSIVKTIHFSYLPIIYLWATPTPSICIEKEDRGDM